MGECMVCLNNTYNKFMCKHYMCESCAAIYLLKYGKHNCPMCNTDIFINENTLKEMVNYAKRDGKMTDDKEKFFTELFKSLEKIKKNID
jgi:hypothetical protein